MTDQRPRVRYDIGYRLKAAWWTWDRRAQHRSGTDSHSASHSTRRRSPRSSPKIVTDHQWTGPAGATFPAIIKNGVAPLGGQRRPELVGVNWTRRSTDAAVARSRCSMMPRRRARRGAIRAGQSVFRGCACFSRSHRIAAALPQRPARTQYGAFTSRSTARMRATRRLLAKERHELVLGEVG